MTQKQCRVSVFPIIMITVLVCHALAFAAEAETTQPARDENGKVIDTNRAYHEKMVKAFAEQNKAAKPGGIVFVGDSITQGFPTGVLHAEVPVHNRGISGDKIGSHYYGVLDRLEESVYDLEPSVVFLLIGINNFTYWTTPPDVMEKGYDRLLRELERNIPKANVYVQSVLPLRGHWADRNERVLEVNNALKKLAAKHGHTYLDIHQYLVNENGELNEGFTYDGLHLNPAGYLEWIKHLPHVRIPREESLATNKKVTVSGGTQGAQLPELAVDGIADNISSWWATPAPQWVEVDLGEAFRIDRVKICPYYDGRRYYQYTVAISTDGEKWERVADMSENNKPSSKEGDVHEFAQCGARFVRVTMLKNSANEAVHINEIFVFEAK